MNEHGSVSYVFGQNIRVFKCGLQSRRGNAHKKSDASPRNLFPYYDSMIPTRPNEGVPSRRLGNSLPALSSTVLKFPFGTVAIFSFLT